VHPRHGGVHEGELVVRLGGQLAERVTDRRPLGRVFGDGDLDGGPTLADEVVEVLATDDRQPLVRSDLQLDQS
jgi:hypothetical protein